MTDMAGPPEDAEERRKRAQAILREFPPGCGVVSAKELRAYAREVLRELGEDAAPKSRRCQHGRSRRKRIGR